MIFNVFLDSGNLIRGTVIPDSLSLIPKIHIIANGREVGALFTNEINQAIRDMGLHSTGSVDFSITDEVVPNLAALEDLELRVDDGDLLIYRRFRQGMRNEKYLRLETQLLPLWRLDDSVKSNFQMYYRQIERLGRSGTNQVFLLSQDSIYLSGRILFSNFSFCQSKGFKSIVILRDPYEELAERLLIMNMSAKEPPGLLDDREVMIYRDALAYAATASFGNEKEARKFFFRMPMAVSLSLANPVVRQFCTSTPDEQSPMGGVARTLDRLAESAYVGLRSDPKQILHAYSELFGIDIKNPDIFPHFPKVTQLAERIRHLGFCDAMLEKDLELFHHVSEAHRHIAPEGGESKS